MSLTVGPAFTIPGYTTTVPPDYDTECDAAVYEANVVVDHPAFWWHYLAGPLGADREADTAFPVAASELHAMRAVLDDRERWPVVSVCLGGEPQELPDDAGEVLGGALEEIGAS